MQFIQGSQLVYSKKIRQTSVVKIALYLYENNSSRKKCTYIRDLLCFGGNQHIWGYVRGHPRCQFGRGTRIIPTTVESMPWQDSHARNSETVSGSCNFKSNSRRGRACVPAAAQLELEFQERVEYCIPLPHNPSAPCCWNPCPSPPLAPLSFKICPNSACQAIVWGAVCGGGASTLMWEKLFLVKTNKVKMKDICFYKYKVKPMVTVVCMKRHFYIFGFSFYIPYSNTRDRSYT